MPITITQAEVNAFQDRLRLKMHSTLEPILKDDVEILNTQQTQEILQYALNNFGPNSVGMLFKKSDTGLSRSFVIGPNVDGVLELIVITNRKISSGKKINKIGLLGSGIQKDVKYGVRVDTTVAEPRAVMKIELCPVDASETLKGNVAETLQKLIVEAERSHRYNSPHIVKTFIGPKYTHTIPVNAEGLKARIGNYSKRERDKLKKVEFEAVLMFSPYAGRPLTKLFTKILTKSEKTQIAADKKARKVPAICIKLIKEILHGLSAMNAVGDIHSDLCSGNILVTRDIRDGTPTAAIIDFGSASSNVASTLDTPSISYIFFEMLRRHPDFDELDNEGSSIDFEECDKLLGRYPILENFAIGDTPATYTASQLLEQLNNLEQAPDTQSRRPKLRAGN